MMRNGKNGGRGEGGGGGGGGPCGACKFLRRKCVEDCIFAPYFDSEQGVSHFAAVHKVFGASNASKLLSGIPPPLRLHAVLTLSYEALSRVRDPVYGCLSHIFSLQLQVVNLQAELAYIQARLSTLQRLPLLLPPPSLHPPQSSPSLTTLPSSSEMSSTSDLMPSNPNMSMHFDQIQVRPQQISSELTSSLNPFDAEQELAHEFVSRYLPAVRLKPPSSH